MTLTVRQSFLHFLICFCVILVGVSSNGCSSSSPRATTRSAMESYEDTEESDTVRLFGENNPAINRRTVLAGIMLMMRIPYIAMGSDTTGFDCSGFTAKIYNEMIGTVLPHSTREQFTLGKAVKRRQLKFGDLVFFRMEGEIPSHVGIYVGDGLFAHASTSLGVTISLLGSSYYKHRYAGARRIVE
jgi:cell wall-associated NlpC family hydrolase